jgi:hypothetical protein
MAHREANPLACGGTTSSNDAPRWACCLVAVCSAATLAARGNATDNGPAAAYRQAVAKTRATRYLVLSQGDAAGDLSGGELLISPHLLVIKSRGRIVAWTTRTYEWTWRPSSHCYERHTDFNRDDARQERAGVLPADVERVVTSRRGANSTGWSAESPGAATHRQLISS